MRGLRSYDEERIPSDLCVLHAESRQLSQGFAHKSRCFIAEAAVDSIKIYKSTYKIEKNTLLLDSDSADSICCSLSRTLLEN